MMDISRSSRDHRPETNWATRLTPKPRSEASDQNIRSGRWALGRPRREDSVRLTTRTDLGHSRVSRRLKPSHPGSFKDPAKSVGGISSRGDPLGQADRKRTADPTGSPNERRFTACTKEILLSAIKVSGPVPEMGKPSKSGSQ